MAEFALVMGGEFREVRAFSERPSDIPHKQVQWFPVVRQEGDAFQGVVNDTYLIVTPPPVEPDPGLLPPRMVAAAFNLAIADGDVTQIGGAFNLIAVLYLDVGQYMLLFLEPEQDTDYFAQPIGGAPCMTVSEKGADYLIVEARDAPGGNYIDPETFNIQVYRI